MNNTIGIFFSISESTIQEFSYLYRLLQGQEENSLVLAE